MQERPILNFQQAQDHADFEFLIIPESRFIPFIAVIGVFAAGAVLFWCIRRRRQS
jgi:hypothetical protein